jgi:hypothetical protein
MAKDGQTMNAHNVMILPLSSWLVLVCCLSMSCLKQDIERQLLGRVTLSSEWLDVEPDPPLKPSRQVQMIVLVTSDPFEPDFQSRGIRLSGGTTTVPEIQVVDQDGNIYDLKTQTISGNTEASYWKVALPTDRLYTRVRMRSDNAFTCEKVLWRCHNMK